MQPDKNLIEPRFKQTIDLYVENGMQTGGFINAVLENNLKESFGRADSEAIENLPHIVAYLYNEVPSDCWGSKQKVLGWYTKFF